MQSALLRDHSRTWFHGTLMKAGSPQTSVLNLATALHTEACEWPESYFAEHIWFDEWPQKLRLKILTLDPSKGADARSGDFSAFVRLGLADPGVIYVEADLARRSTPQIVADGVAHWRQFRPDAFGIEANQYQELLGEQFAVEFRRQGLLSVQP